MKNKPDFKNLRVLPSGFQVAIMRRGRIVTRHFAGHTPDSYAAAIVYRNHLIRELPEAFSLRAA
jgi:hypothetical protein